MELNFVGERFVPGKAFGEIEVEHLQRYLSIIELVKDKIVLDAACGEGYGSHILSEYAKQVTGIDISVESINWASNKYDRTNLTYELCSIEKLPFEDKSIDVVVSFETIEHVNEAIQNSFLAEVKRVLKEDGICVISTPNKRNYSDLEDFKNQFHVKEFYLNEFREFLNHHFKNIYLYGQGFEQFSVLKSLDSIDVGNQFRVISMDDKLNEYHKYIVAICCQYQLKTIDSYQSLMLLRDEPKYYAKLYVDFGGGFSEEVKVVSQLHVIQNQFTIQFDKLNSLKEIQGLRFCPFEGQINAFKIDEIKSNINNLSIEASNKHKTENGYDVYLNTTPYYNITGDFEGLDFVWISGKIDFISKEKLTKIITDELEHMEQEASKLIQEKNRLEIELTDINRNFSDLSNSFVEEMKKLNAGILYQQNFIESTILSLEKALETANDERKREVAKNISLSSKLDNIIIEKNKVSIERDQLIKDMIHLDFLKYEAERVIQVMMGTKTWRYTEIIRKVNNLKFKGSLRKGTKRLLRKIYIKLPLNPRKKYVLKKVFYTVFKPFIKKTEMYSNWMIANGTKSLSFEPKPVTMGATYDFSKIKAATQPGTIAIHLHLFYVDLIEEFLSQLSYMPYDFDLFISIPLHENSSFVASKLKKIRSLVNYKIITVENKGRDVLPFVVHFAKDLMKYDYVCHIHTKKSLYTGNVQDEWRNHLVSNLFGSTDRVEKIFGIFETYENVGLLYPETYSLLPYWSHTWLSNKSKASTFLRLKKIDISNLTYIDYPAGTMFWAKKDAIKKLLDGTISESDFDPEAKQTDGTLAHVIERAIVPIVKENHSIVEVNFDKNYYRLNMGGRNLYQYWMRKKADFFDFVDHFDVISFDIFDTLVTRPIFEPDHIFEIIEMKIVRELKLKINFRELRKEAENQLRLSGMYSDVSIHDIYKNFKEISCLDETTTEQIKKIEIYEELNLVIPRYDVVDCLKYVKYLGKKVILISDMYLTKEHLKKMLEKINVSVEMYDDIWVSSETKKRKDTNEIWLEYEKLFKNQRTLHVGDNEHSDIQLPTDLKLGNYHVMSGKNMFSNTQLGDYISNRYTNITLGDSIVLGTIIARDFNSPFALNATEGIYQINDYKNLGYSYFGPTLFLFFVWLVKRTREEKVDFLLFLAREGFLFTNLYKKISEYFPDHTVEYSYFLSSRRAISITSINQLDDIYNLLESNFKGAIRDLFLFRFGLKVDIDEEINLPNDYDKVKKIVNIYQQEIFQRAEEEKEAYRIYCDGFNFNNYQKIGIVDLGYSGSIQYYFSKFMKRQTQGFYFATSDNQKGKKYRGNEMEGFFVDNEHYLSSKNPIFKYQLVLESILTSPEGQLINFHEIDGHPAPNFGKSGLSQINFSKLEEVHQGVLEFFDDILTKFGGILFEQEYTKDIVEDIFEFALKNDAFLSSNIKDIFFVEDNYCSSNEITVFDFYNELFERDAF